MLVISNKFVSCANKSKKTYSHFNKYKNFTLKLKICNIIFILI